ncbi:hypothetical protein PENSPDRAFT_680221 [Peniophora sp. CONT]|nr:hypothetical protein PENSPDRAFT_680221 [Peniophora sp. CONT]
MPLTGCHNDAHSFAELLRNCYGWEDITVMTDEEENFETELWPSTSNMRSKLRDLVAGARPGDMFVVYYAGHSDQVVAINDSQEKDGYDEHMIPVDGAVILDDELRELLIDPLCKGARLTAVFDSCHSGTMLDLYWYPTRTRKSDVTHDRDRKAATLESLVVRSHSMPSPTTIFWGVTKRVKKFPWTAIRAFAKLYAIPKRKARLTTIVPADPPIVTLNEATLPYDTLTVDVALHGNLNVSASDISASDNSSFLTGNTPSTLGELAIHHEPEVIADAHFVAEERADEAPPACKDCEHLANRSPIVNSIAACQDDQQALEDIGKKASIMTPALIDLLTNEPELSARDIQKKLQPKLFQACCRFIVDTLKNKRHPCDRMKKKAKLQRKVMTMVNDMPWQVVQPGAEEDQASGHRQLSRIFAHLRFTAYERTDFALSTGMGREGKARMTEGDPIYP